ncbi:hypothetical protein C8F04DRAFT_1043107 [Mycena alexandri]|uniref:Uncharacterized protein n=1 Tax=Mycena alexandri TaxID=1745969 RepID=A0AAD6WZZ5_9AGAR|nr:hypothetical protein C8F04DRAFT_1043107 [Mycena alexandri]
MQSLSAILQLDPFDPRHNLVTSSFFSPGVLAAIRLSMACYTFVTLGFTIVWGIVVTKDAAGFFSYFTHLTYCGLCGYLFAAGIQTALYARRGQKAYPLQRWAKPWRFLHMALLSTITAFPILVSIVFWGVIADASTFDNRFDAWNAISVHLLNSVFALFEILLTNTPASAWILLPFGILLLSGYVGIIYITYATQGFYAYTFMNPDGHPGRLALHILGVGLAECVVFTIVHGLVVARQRGVARFRPTQPTPTSDVKSLSSASDDVSAWADVDIREKGAV